MEKKSRNKVMALSPLVAAMLAVAGNASAASQNDAAQEIHDASAASVLHAETSGVELDLTGIITMLDAPLDAELLAAQAVKCTFYSNGDTKCTYYSSNRSGAQNIADAGDAGGFFNV